MSQKDEAKLYETLSGMLTDDTNDTKMDYTKMVSSLDALINDPDFPDFKNHLQFVRDEWEGRAETFAHPLGETGQFDPMAVDLIDFGEDFQLLPTALQKAAYFLRLREEHNPKKMDEIVFASSLGLAYDNGVPLMRALGTLGQNTSSTYNKEVLGEIHDRIMEREPFFTSFLSKKEMFSPSTLYMIGTGEQAGNLGKNLHTASDILIAEAKAPDVLTDRILFLASVGGLIEGGHSNEHAVNLAYLCSNMADFPEMKDFIKLIYDDGNLVSGIVHGRLFSEETQCTIIREHHRIEDGMQVAANKMLHPYR